MPQTHADEAGVNLNHLSLDDQRDVSRLITRISIFSFPLLTFFAIRSFVHDAVWQGLILNLFSVLLLVNTVLFFKYKKHGIYKWVSNILIMLLFAYITLSAVEEGAGILWLYAFPPLVFYMSDLRTGTFLCLLGIVAVALLFSPIGPSLGSEEYATSFKLAFMSSLVFEMAFCYVLDSGRRQNREQLINLARHFEYVAKHDSLTGLFNRREGTARLNAEHSRCLRHGRMFSLLLLDIDHFKHVNDTWGHEAGDVIIRQVANTLTHLCRRSDAVARWGGEEFLIILPETGPDEALVMAQRIREQIAAGRVHYRDQQLGVTTSLGVASVQEYETLDNMLRRADENLYAAKAGGRNMVVV